jgi:uncharacterized protein with ATP-grasp and redox domains
LKEERLTGEAIVKLMIESCLVRYVEDLAQSFTRNKREQKTLIAKAWTTIAELFDEKTEEYYMRVAYTAMRKHYEIYQMPIPKRKVSDDAGIRRANRTTKRLVAYPLKNRTYTNEGL